MNKTPERPVGATAARGWTLFWKSKIVREGERALSLRAQEERGRAMADEHGYCVRVHVHLDLMDERDRRWIIDQAENACEYSQRLSHNVRSSKSRQRTEGRWLSKAPFGLVSDPHTRKLAHDHTLYMCTAANRREVTPWEIVQRVFKAIGEGTSSRALTRKLNTEGLRTGTGVPWRADAVRAIIIHPVYEGWLTHCPGGKAHRDRVPFLDTEGKRSRVVTAETLPHMIPSELAERARRVLSGNQTISKIPPTPGRPTRALTSRIRCASCDSAMTLEGDSYNCTRYGGGSCAAPVFVRRSAIELRGSDMVRRSIARTIMTPCWSLWRTGGTR
ncbi:recombinase family protein [Streptomyces sp. NPDC055254]